MEKIVSSKPRRLPTQCQICEGPALYSYVGAIVCPSCKMFFKRNASLVEVKNLIDRRIEFNFLFVLFSQKRLTCFFEGNCPINRQKRQLCSACRLEKCFSNGMQKQLLRASTAKVGRKYRKAKETTKTVVIHSRQVKYVVIEMMFRVKISLVTFN